MFEILLDYHLDAPHCAPFMEQIAAQFGKYPRKFIIFIHAAAARKMMSISNFITQRIERAKKKYFPYGNF